jgi:hypothetical protein
MACIAKMGLFSHAGALGKQSYCPAANRVLMCYRCSAQVSSSASFWMAVVSMLRSQAGRSCG